MRKKMSLINDLKRGAFFQELADDYLEKISNLCDEEILHNQDIIFEEGAKAEKIYILQKGAVSLQINLKKYQDIIISTIEEKGELFGWSALIEPKKYSATVKCLKETTVYSISTDKLEQWFEDDPLMGFVFMKRIASLIDNRLSSMRKRLLSSIA
jgi:CRP-like cAMP-binding protein